MATAVALRITDAEDAGGTRLEVELAGKFFGFLPFGDVGQDFPFDEAAHRIANQLMGLVEVFLVGRHGKTPR
ncbi:hypothetical protein D9M70_374510 [compost metagenome]